MNKRNIFTVNPDEIPANMLPDPAFYDEDGELDEAAAELHEELMAEAFPDDDD